MARSFSGGSLQFFSLRIASLTWKHCLLDGFPYSRTKAVTQGTVRAFHYNEKGPRSFNIGKENESLQGLVDTL
ncbi:hypothetical protein F8388_008172 [Cannabis sativa]|uniref:Uncharacterized protein n=1 Tax=Cannabis sativa TaxID=3483 RepID=A0A7J6EV77_CANSA|nr:hypothetical protein F8388_008172 [Cannabis sativa]KAF4391302.1 hypothetical protein G4B88_016612 [Cannabis sativa]